MNKQCMLTEGDQSIKITAAGLSYIKARLWPTGMADDRITDYIVYHLYRRRNLSFKFYATDLFSEHSVNKFYDQFLGPNKRTGMNYYIDEWLKDGGLSRKAITEMIAGPKPSKLEKFIYMPSEELIKQRFLNTELGYSLCQNNTTGWAPKSEMCGKCNFKEDCMAETSRKYPDLIRLRRKNQ